jgi:signal transduction histidine kinase
MIGLVLTAGRLPDAAFITVVNLLITSGFLLGGRRGLQWASMYVISLAGLAWLIDAGLTPPPLIDVTEQYEWLYLVCVVLEAFGIVYLGVNSMNGAVLAAEVSAHNADKALKKLRSVRVVEGRRAIRAERLGMMARNLVGQREPPAFSAEVAIGLRDALEATVVLVVGRGGRVHAAAGLGSVEQPSLVFENVFDTMVAAGSFRSLDGPERAQLGLELNIATPALTLAARGSNSPLTVFILGASAGMDLGEMRWPVQMSVNLLDAAMLRYESEGRLIQAQKMDSLNRLSAGIAHDFNNLLTTILGGAELLEQRAEPSDPILGHLRRIRKAGERAATLTAKLMTFTRTAPRVAEVLDLPRLLSDLLPILRRSIEESIHIELHDTDQAMWVEGDPMDLERIILNLVANGRDAIGPSGRIDVGVELRSQGKDGLGMVVLWVQDDGEGMGFSVRTRVFEPFFTTRKDEGASGLGLSIVYGVATALGGSVFIDSAEGAGTCVEVHIPAKMPPLNVAEQPRVKVNSGGCILVVEDDPDVRDTVCEMLQLGGYQTDEAVSGTDALDLLNSDKVYLMVLSDVVMPSMSGFELAEKMAEAEMSTPIALLSGYAPGGESEDGAPIKLPRLTKPFTLAELLAFVASI